MSRGPSALPNRGLGLEAVAITGLAVVASVAFGMAAATRTEDLVVALAIAFVIGVSLFAPLASLALLVLAALLVPYPVQNQYSIGGGTAVPGLLAIDVMLLVGLARATVTYYARGRLDATALLAYTLLALVVLQMLHGIAAGWTASDAGTEARNVAMAAGAFLLSVPVLADPRRRRRLPVLLLVASLALGFWGLAQWVFDAPFNGSDFGVREGRFGTSSGRGQLQGGLFVYHAAVIMTFGALISGWVASGWPRLLTVVALASNLLCLFFTYERTFWAAAALGCLFVAARSKPEARRRALKWVPALGAGLILVLAAVAPSDLITALERGASVSEVKSDESGLYRVVESQHVLDEIRARPAEGSGFGAEITWEPPEFRGTELTTPFSHNGYLWLAWKAGLPFLLACVAILVACFMRRGPAVNDSLMGVLRLGAQASLMALLVINITFPSFNFLSIAVVTGFLAAFCWFPRRLP